MNRNDLFQCAYAAKHAETKSAFLAEAKRVIGYFFNAESEAQLKAALRRSQIQIDLSNEQECIDLIHAVWGVVSGGHVDRHAVERLIERMSEEHWWANISQMRVLEAHVERAFAAI